jgi:hypothetical protein
VESGGQLFFSNVEVMDNSKSIFICEDEDENKKHIHALDILAKSLGGSTDGMLAAYRYEFNRLSRQARIKTFLPILIARKVQNIVRR